MTLEWIDKRERMPGAEDADVYGCVLIFDVNNGIMVSGWKNRQQLERGPVTHWARMPEGPARREPRRGD